MRDLDHRFDTIEGSGPLTGEVTLLDVDESGDDLPLLAVKILLIQQLYNGLGHGVTGAGGDGALAGRCRCGSGRTVGDLVWARSYTYTVELLR